ncbi:MAG: RNase H family protein [Eubacteriales bacterium]
MKNTTIHVAAVLKPKTNIACYGITTSKKNARKPIEHSGNFTATGRTETQLIAMIKAISLAEEADEITLYTESSVITNFTNGTVATWELADWCAANGKPVENLELWKELNTLVENKHVKFLSPKAKKEMSLVNKLLKAEKDKTEAPTTEAPKVVETPKAAKETAPKKAPTPKVEKKSPKITKETLQKTTKLIKTEAKEVAKKVSQKQPKLPTKPATPPESLVIDLDPKTKKQCDTFFQELGLDTETAVKLFLAQSLRDQSIPFQITLK